MRRSMKPSTLCGPIRANVNAELENYSPSRYRTYRCILYIVKRTQLYLDDDLLAALHARARLIGTTISSLVREAVRERYAGKLEARKAAMQAFVGLRKDRPEFADSAAYLRGLRRGNRLSSAARK
jgi:Arc/MetJ family transcription regulator